MAEAGAVCVLPVGSLEQHGEHLPVGTDSLLVETVCLRAAGLAHADVVVAPTVWTGLSPHHVRLGVTVTLEPELLLELTRQIVRCLRPWFREVVIVNGHGGNRGWLGALALAEECPFVNYWELVEPSLLRDLFSVDLGSVGHAGQVETSAMLTVAPELVGTASPAFEPITRANDPFLLPGHGGERRARRSSRRLSRRRRAVHRKRLSRRSRSCSTPSQPPTPRRADHDRVPRRRRLPAARASARAADGRVHPPALERTGLRAAARGGGSRPRARRHARRAVRRRRRGDHPPADRAADRSRRGRDGSRS